MADTLLELLLATVLFVLGHVLLSTRPVRTRLIGTMGEPVFKLVYSAAAIAAFLWMISAYNRAPQEILWADTAAARMLLLFLMLPATLLVAGGPILASPTAQDIPGLGIAKATDGDGIFAVTRHPIMWGVALWAAGHMLVNGDAASVILFGGLVVLALIGMLHIDTRRRAVGGEGWRRFESRTSIVPFFALLEGRADWSSLRIASWRLALGLVLYAVFIIAHEPVIGRSPLPL